MSPSNEHDWLSGEPDLEFAQRYRRSCQLAEEEEANRAYMQRLLALRSKNVLDMSKAMRALDISAEEVSGKVAFAKELNDRHQALHRGTLFADAIQQWSATGETAGLDHARKVACELGAFLQSCDACSRLEDPSHWVLTHAKGKKIDPQTLLPLSQESVFVSDCHIQLPDDDAAGQGVAGYLLPDLDRGDMVNTLGCGQSIIEHVRQNPAIAGVVDNVSTEDNYAGLGLAGAALEQAIAFVRQRNANRRNAVRYLFAAIFSVRGLQTTDGTQIRPSDPIDNVRSILIHTEGRTKFGWGWTLKDRLEPVQLSDGSSGHLIVNWNVLTTDLKRTANGPVGKSAVSQQTQSGQRSTVA